MKKLLRFLGYILVTLSLIFLFQNLVKNLDSIPKFPLGYRSIFILTIAIVLCSAIVLALSVAWSILIKGGNISLSVRQAYVIMGKSQIGRYLPGNIWHYAGRVALGRKYGIPTEATILSTGVETVTILGTGLAIAAIGLFLDDRSYFQFIEAPINSQNLLISLVILMVTFSILIGLTRIKPIAKSHLWLSIKNWISDRLPYINAGRIAASSLVYVVIFLIFGITISLLLSMLWQIEVGLNWYQFVWGFAIAWVAGFVTPGAPGGLGVRETILTTLYSPELGEGLALGLSLMLRVVTSLGDLLAFVLAYYLERTYNKSYPPNELES